MLAGSARSTVWPQRSPLPKGAETEVGPEPGPVGLASTKSAPQRSGDTEDDGGSRVRRAASTKSAPQRSGDYSLGVAMDASVQPQRSPLPKGAETEASDGYHTHSELPQRSLLGQAPRDGVAV